MSETKSTRREFMELAMAGMTVAALSERILAETQSSPDGIQIGRAHV